jgi:hypothetical protein
MMATRTRAHRRSGYGMLFHRGRSLGVVDYVLGPMPAPDETRAMHLHAPYVSAERVRGEALTVLLDTGELLDGYCQRVEPSSWLLFRLRPSIGDVRHD